MIHDRKVNLSKIKWKKTQNDFFQSVFCNCPFYVTIILFHEIQFNLN